MRALITGSNGFIGSHLAEALVGRGDEARCLVRTTSRTHSLEGLPLRLVFGDTRDKASLKQAVRGVDCVYHVAGAINARNWQTYEDVNITGTRNLVEACLEDAPRLQRFLFVSSIGAAGPSSCDTPLTEADEPRPVSDYGRSKLLAEEIVHQQAGRLPTTIIRPPNVLGPRQRELWQSIRLIRRGVLPLVGTTRTRTSIIGVADLVRSLVVAAEHPRSVGQTYLVAYRQPYTWREITATLAETLGVTRTWVRVPYLVQYAVAALSELGAWVWNTAPLISRSNVRAARDYCWVYDGSKIERELGVHPSMNLEAILHETVAWYRTRGML